jgi:hypothetical protein
MNVCGRVRRRSSEVLMLPRSVSRPDAFSIMPLSLLLVKARPSLPLGVTVPINHCDDWSYQCSRGQRRSHIRNQSFPKELRVPCSSRCEPSFLKLRLGCRRPGTRVMLDHLDAGCAWAGKLTAPSSRYRNSTSSVRHCEPATETLKLGRGMSSRQRDGRVKLSPSDSLAPRYVPKFPMLSEVGLRQGSACHAFLAAH